MGKSEQSSGGSFSSFGALRKASGGDEAAPEPEVKKPEKGWVVESTEGDEIELSEEELAALPPLDVGVPNRITDRPPAFAPMGTGPAPYQDVESDEMVILRGFRIRTIFPDDVNLENANLPDDPRPEDIEGRLDLRDQLIFTVDGSDAKDYDDAIQIEPRDHGGFMVGVHIADVSHYVAENTALDDEALARGTSVYLADQVVPMLPEELSNGLCSLVPDRDRLAHSVFMEFDAAGERTSAKINKSVIRSKKRCTYKAVQEVLDGADTEDAAALVALPGLKQALQHFSTWTRVQQKIRDAKGSLRINSHEKKFVFDEDHEVKAVVIAPRYFSQTLIEETALAANQAVGDSFRTRGLPTIYRVHPEKDPEEVETICKMLEKFGIRVPKKERLTGRDIGRMIRLARKRTNADTLVRRIMSLVERAVYEVKDHEDVAEHWGLARKAYLHFTSPIRRYPDLIVHRWLTALESGQEGASEALKSEALLAELNATATHASMQADMAGIAEMAMYDLKVCQYMEPMIGKKLEAKVRQVSRRGIQVDLVGLNVSGFLPTKALGDRPRVVDSTLTVQAGKRQLSFTEGYPIGIMVDDVDFLRLQVLLILA